MIVCVCTQGRKKLNITSSSRHTSLLETGFRVTFLLLIMVWSLVYLCCVLSV